MTTNWNFFLDKAKQVANAAGKKTEEVVESSKLQLQIFNLNASIQSAYETIGSLVYHAQKSGLDSSAEIEDALAQVDALFAQLEELEAKVAQIRKTKKCPNCGASCDADSRFCSRCGAIVEAPLKPTPYTAPAEPAAPYVDVEVPVQEDSEPPKPDQQL